MAGIYDRVAFTIHRLPDPQLLLYRHLLVIPLRQLLLQELNSLPINLLVFAQFINSALRLLFLLLGFGDLGFQSGFLAFELLNLQVRRLLQFSHIILVLAFALLDLKVEA